MATRNTFDIDTMGLSLQKRLGLGVYAPVRDSPVVAEGSLAQEKAGEVLGVDLGKTSVAEYVIPVEVTL